MIILTALAVYKVLQVVLVLLPREVQPWVKVIAGVVISIPVTLLSGLEDVAISSLAVATLAGATHTVLRLLTYVGDLAIRRSIR